MVNKLEKSFRDFDKSLSKEIPQIPGELGISIGGHRRTEVPNRGQYVYVRLRSNLSEVVQAFNEKVFPGYGLPVLVQWNNNRYEITGRDVQRYPEWEADNPYIARHGNTHSLDVEGGEVGTDPVWVYPYQFMPSLVSPFDVNNVENVYIHPYTVNYNGDWKTYGNTGTPSLIDYSPVSGKSLVLITVNGETGNPTLFATTGTFIPTSVSGVSGLAPYLPSVNTQQYLPLSFVELVSGTSSISWNNLYDVRQLIGFGSGGALPTLDGKRVVVTDADGNIVVVSDMVYDPATNSIIIGGDETVFPSTMQNKIIVIGDGDSTGIFKIVLSDELTDSAFFAGIRGGGTLDAPTAVVDGMVLDRMRGRGLFGNSLSNVTSTQVEIEFVAVGDWDATNHGTKLNIYTTPEGSTTRTLVMTITEDGHVDIAENKQYWVNGEQHKHDASDIVTGEIKAISEDAASVYQRMLAGRANYSWVDFDESTIPAEFAGWAGSPFVTPDTVDLTTYPSVLALTEATNGDRAFLYRSAAPTTGRGLLGVFGFALGTDAFVGLRIDDGSDNNYVEAGIYGGGTTKWLMRTYWRSGGGTVTTTTATDAALGPLMPQVLLNITGTRWASWGFNAWLSYPQNQSAFLAQMNLVAGTTGLTWTPTRVGITFRNISSTNVAGVERFGY